MIPKNAFDDVVDAVVATLSAPPAIAERISEDDQTALPESVSSALVIVFRGAEPALHPLASGPTDWVTHVDVQCHVRADSASSTGRASRKLFAEVFSRLMADQTLGGAATLITPRAVISDQELRGSRIGCCIGGFAISHRTPQTAIEPYA